MPNWVWTNDSEERYFGLYKVEVQDSEGYVTDYTNATSKELDYIKESMQDENNEIVTYKYALVI